MFNEGSNEMSNHLDRVLNHGISKGMNESEAALYAVTKFVEFLSHPDNLERAFRENPEVAAAGTIDIIRWVNEWLFVKTSAWKIPNTLEGILS